MKTAETDLYPFQPDLLIFHVYGAHNCYEDIIRRTRERTTAEILIQTDHVNARADWRHEETDPAKVTPKDWDSFMNYKHLPAVIRRYGCGYVDQRNLWKRHLAERGLEANSLLRDDVHLNDEGCRVMAAFVKAALVKRDDSSFDPMNCGYVRTFIVGKDLDIASGSLETRLRRQSHRLDRRPRLRAADCRLDRRQETVGAPGVGLLDPPLPKPGGPWPVVADLSSEKPLLVEEWTMNVARDPAKEDLFTFTLSGSETGLDGSGRSDTRFVSPSGRVVIDPEDWDVSYALGLARVNPVPASFTVRWRVVPRHLDEWQPAASQPGIENVVTLAHGLIDGPHTLELSGEPLGPGRRAGLFAPKIPDERDRVTDGVNHLPCLAVRSSSSETRPSLESTAHDLLCSPSVVLDRVPCRGCRIVRIFRPVRESSRPPIRPASSPLPSSAAAGGSAPVRFLIARPGGCRIASGIRAWRCRFPSGRASPVG